MSKENYLQNVYDDQMKIWKSVNYPYKHFWNISLGEQFLRTMRSIDKNKIIDHFYDKNLMQTAQQVYEKSILIALNLQRLGVKKGDIVILFSMNNEWTSVLTFGCILIGALPIFFEVQMKEADIVKLFENLQATIILYEKEYFSKIENSLQLCNIQTPRPQLISIDDRNAENVQTLLLNETFDETIDFMNFKNVEILDPQNEIACLVLTSGSTGIPKIVQISHTLMMHGVCIWWDNEGNYEPLDEENSVILSFSPLRWISQIAIMFKSMLFGIRRVSSCGKPNGLYGLDILRYTGVTHIFVAPSIFYDILLQLDDEDKESLKTVRFIQLGGEPPSKVIMELTKKHALNAKTFHCYGMTEMCSCITNDEFINGGKLLPGYELQILDDYLKPLGPNESGQISIRSAVGLKGYRGLDESEISLNDSGLFINGDYGYVDDNQKLHIQARYKDLIRSNGVIVIPNALEYEITNLREVYVARLAGYRRYSHDPNEVGTFFVVLNANVSLTHTEISTNIFQTLKSRLTEEEFAIIEDIYFVDSVPLTTCGKIDRIALKQLALSLFRSSNDPID